MDDPAPLVDLDPEHPNAPGGAETHSSVLLFAGKRAYKVYKPVRLDVLDYSTAGQRESALRRELRLNRRFAPDVYLDVATIVGGEGQPVEHALVMRRMPADRRLARLLETDERDRQLRSVARRVAAIHAAAPRPPSAAEAAGAVAVSRNWEQNQVALEGFAATLLDAQRVERVGALFRRYVAGRAALFEARVAGGYAIDGHGDLLAEDIFCLPDGPRILDCLAFDDRLRHGDALLDAAFLAMDVERLAGRESAERFLGWYAEFSGERHPASLAHHYVAYRAQVRCKVAAVRWTQGDASAGVEAGDHLRRCEEHLAAGRVRLVLVGGAPGTGKSTVAQALGDRLGWVVLSSDLVRKERAGLPPAQSAAAAVDGGLYEAAGVAATYGALLDRARTLLGLGEHVVLDASWTDAGQRGLARTVADETAAEVVELRLDVPLDVARARIAARTVAGGGASDATLEVADALRRRAAPWPEAHALDATGPIADVVDAAGRLVS